jgi:hypothetical protein
MNSTATIKRIYVNETIRLGRFFVEKNFCKVSNDEFFIVLCIISGMIVSAILIFLIYYFDGFQFRKLDDYILHIENLKNQIKEFEDKFNINTPTSTSTSNSSNTSSEDLYSKLICDLNNINNNNNV